MSQILLLDGIGDISGITDLKSNVPNNSFLMLGNVFKQIECTVLYEDGRDSDYSEINLNRIINEEKISTIIINTNLNNYLNIIRLSNSIHFLKYDIFYFYDNLIVGKLLENKNINPQKMVFYDEMKSCQENFEFILIHFFNYRGKFTLKYNPEFWSILHHNISYSYEISVCSGHNKKGLLTHANNWEPLFLQIENVIGEIKYLLNIGVKHIHIKNHYLIKNKSFINSLSIAIQENFEKDNFTMSCVLSAKELIKNIDILDDLKDTKKIDRLEILIHFLDENIYNELVTIFKKISELDFTSVVINYVIGTPSETKESLNKLKDFSKTIIDYLPGKVEFSFSYYYNDAIDVNEDKQNSLLRKGFLLKYNSNMPIEQLISFKSIFFEEISKISKESLKKLNQNQRVNHIILANNGILTYYYYLFLSKYEIETAKALKIGNKIWINSLEIEENIFKYTPIIVRKLYYIENNRKVLFIDTLFTESTTNYIELNDFDFFLYQQSRGLKNIDEIYNSSIKQFLNISSEKLKQNILAFFSNLEKYGLVSFVKLLN